MTMPSWSHDRHGLPRPVIDDRVIAVIREPDERLGASSAHRVLQAGITAVEVTLTTPGALAIIRELRDSWGAEVTIGVGSVTDGIQVREAVESGAEFIVTPASRPPVHEAAHELGVPVIAGAMTPTELLAAWDRPATAALKLFPSASLGPSYLRDVLAPLPGLPVMPSGGVDVDNARAWFEAGAVAVSIGGALMRGLSATDDRLLADRVATLRAAAQWER